MANTPGLRPSRGATALGFDGPPAARLLPFAAPRQLAVATTAPRERDVNDLFIPRSMLGAIDLNLRWAGDRILPGIGVARVRYKMLVFRCGCHGQLSNAGEQHAEWSFRHVHWCLCLEHVPYADLVTRAFTADGAMCVTGRCYCRTRLPKPAFSGLSAFSLLASSSPAHPRFSRPNPSAR